MTDSEKELRRLAEEAGAVPKEYRQWTLGHFHAAATPAAILALLDRIEALEKQVRPSHPTAEHSQRVVKALEEMLAPLSDGTLGTRDVVGRVAALLEQAKTAERKGAEEMRTAAADGCREWSIPMPIDLWQGTKKELSAATARALADRIQRIPLPGDAP